MSSVRKENPWRERFFTSKVLAVKVLASTIRSKAASFLLLRFPTGD